MKGVPMLLAELSQAVPVPHDLPLPLPVSRALLQILIVVFFLLHIFFVNLMVGGSIMTLIFELLGLKDKKYDRLAQLTAKTITVNKSMAVVLGVGPLLAMNLLYTVYFYTANALTGQAWAMIIPLTISAFLLTYAHKYSWEYLANNKGIHLTIGLMAVWLFLFIPLIFLANANLMLYPERWSEIRGFFSALLIPNVIPRYFHFILACLAITNLFLIWWLGRAEQKEELEAAGLTQSQLRRICYGATFAVTALQFLAGPLLYFTLPAHGVTSRVTMVILLGVASGAYVLRLLWCELLSDDSQLGRHFRHIVLLLSFTVLAMGTGRHFFREDTLKDHRDLIAAKTLEYEQQVAAAKKLGPLVTSGGSAGETVYKTVCIACHQPNGQGLPGAFPPLAGSEWVQASKPDRIIRIVLNGLEGPIHVKGMTYAAAPMPAQRDVLSDEQIAAVLTYARQTWGNKASPVTTEEVKASRSATAGRTKAWTQAELESIPKD